MARLGLEPVLRALRVSFSAETSENPEWDSFYASSGHSRVAALIVYNIFGGLIRCGMANGETIHYWNVIEDVKIDVTYDEIPNLLSITDIREATNDEVPEDVQQKKDLLFLTMFKNLFTVLPES